MSQKAADKVTYLSFAQSNISRMASCSLAVKGSCCAVLTALVAVLQAASMRSDALPACCVLLIAVSLAFSVFDCWYLWLERRYRALYRLIDTNEDGTFPTDMLPPDAAKKDGTRRRDVYLSWSVVGFYAVLALMSVAAESIVVCGGGR